MFHGFNIPTEELKSDSYKTYPGRADKLARRAIYALEMHITTIPRKPTSGILIRLLSNVSQLASLPQLKKFYRLNDHNAKHDLNPYDNRQANGRKIDLEIDLVALVRNGQDMI
ncbi:hypothetical protein [uncultured Nostoc sp.]|uniref:hypothetical protein n=1 Tax=uncultured Nostoc sp. TaxID=340711 RepID=UPI002606F7C5|nr:hypothetical protein [uncultured Nostoc sp.]